MTKRIYIFDAKEMGEMIGGYMREKYPELAELSENTDILIKFSHRKKQLIVELET